MKIRKKSSGMLMRAKAVMMLIVLFAAIPLMFGCGKSDLEPEQKNRVSIDAMQAAFAEVDDELHFEKVTNAEGYTFSYHSDSLTSKLTYQGNADENENINSVMIIHENVRTEWLIDSIQLMKIMSKSGDDMTLNDVRIGNCVITFITLNNLFEEGSNDLSVEQIINQCTNLFRGSTLTVGNWEITASLDSANGVATINAVYAH